MLTVYASSEELFPTHSTDPGGGSPLDDDERPLAVTPPNIHPPLVTEADVRGAGQSPSPAALVTWYRLQVKVDNENRHTELLPIQAWLRALAS